MKSKLTMIGLAVMAVVWLAGASAGVARAADNGSLKSLTVMVWPEYDDPRVLVLYEGEFTDATAFPRDVYFYVPAGAANLATAYADDKGDLINTDPATLDAPVDGFARVNVKLPRSRFHIEYYYDPLPKTTDKKFDFAYKAAQPTGAVNLQIQQPLKAENFTTEPAAASQAASNHGFKNHNFAFPSMTAEQTFKVSVQYTKTDPKPSIENVAQTLPATTPGAPAPSGSASSSADWTTYLPVALGAAALALAALAFFAWRSRQGAALQPAHAGPRPRRKGRPAPAASYFCTKCGNGLDEDDMYCPACGTKRRA
ncbi:MAG: zinc ribbon domain-containing protein [Chloroflexi bacterium]|nr:zinc ribbon domain-containing protein [Chloroflexota bacterium]